LRAHQFLQTEILVGLSRSQIVNRITNGKGGVKSGVGGVGAGGRGAVVQRGSVKRGGGGRRHGDGWPAAADPAIALRWAMVRFGGALDFGNTGTLF